MRLLSIDWDYFFRVCERPEDEQFPGEFWFYNWGRCELDARFSTPAIWGMRAEAFISNKKPLPRTTGDEKTFWGRFFINPNAKLFVAESHAQAGSDAVLDGITEIWNYDAHHDAGYFTNFTTPESYFKKFNTVTCEDWMCYAAFLGIKNIFVRYPKWRHYFLEAEPHMVAGDLVQRTVDDELSHGPKTPFDRIFICRSGTWTPTWLDIDFENFVDACPIAHSKSYIGGKVKPRLCQESDHLAPAANQNKISNDLTKNTRQLQS
jgi:hypothetical protein